MGFQGNRFFGFSSKPIFYLVPKHIVTQGQDGNQTSAGSFLRLTGEILFKQPFRIDFVQWDINSAGTYSLQQVNSVAASPTVVRTIANDIIVTTLTKVTVPVWPPLYAACGDLIYLSIVTTPTVQMRRFATNVVSFQSFSYTSIGYDGGSTTTGSIPTKLVGKYWEVKR